MTWVTPMHTFRCGACGTTVTAIATLGGLEKIMRVHGDLCKGFAPTNHESGGDRACESSAAEAGVTPGDSPRAAVAGGSGRGE